MTRSLAFLLALVIAGPAAADDVYVPLPGSATELWISNPADSGTTLELELLGVSAGPARIMRLELAPGGALHWSDVAEELYGGDTGAALRITAVTPVVVKAVNHSQSRGAAALPVLERRSAMTQGSISAGVEPNDLGWQSGIVMINPDAVTAWVAVSLLRGSRMVEVPPHGMSRIRFESTDENAAVTFNAPRGVLALGYDINERTGAVFYRSAVPTATPGRRRAVRIPSTPAPTPNLPETVVLTPSKDNTLYQTSNGGVSNGAGIHVFAGMTNSQSRRRALLAFNIGTQIPPGSQILRVVLTLNVSQTVSGAATMELRRVTTDWGEGSSDAGSSNDGDGAPSQPGDATWLHTFFSDRRWTSQGGDSTTPADASASVAFTGPVSWESSGMIAAVQSWLDQPAGNFGWILIGNETSSRTAKRFDSREHPDGNTRPSLTIEFIRP